MRFFKRLTAMLLCISILTFSFVLTPVSRYKTYAKYDITASANPVYVDIGMELLELLALVLSFVGINVCVDDVPLSDIPTLRDFEEFVNKKLLDLNLSITMLLLNIPYYMSQLVEWGTEFAMQHDEIYTSEVSLLPDYATMLESDAVRLTFSQGTSITNADNTKCVAFYDSCVSHEIYPYFCTSNGYLYFLIPGHNGETYSNMMNVCNQAININYRNTAHVEFDNKTYLYGMATSIFATDGLAVLKSAGIPVPELDLSPVQFAELLVSGAISADSNIGITIPAAKDVFGGIDELIEKAYQVDMPDVIDMSGGLEKLRTTSGISDLTWNDVMNRVASGELSMSDVLEATDAVPYVLVDDRTGEIATTDTPAENIKRVVLDKDLAIPDAATIEAAEDYTPRYDNDDNNPTGKYKFPLFQFFPFCLPWDLYQVFSAFDSEPVAPVIKIPIGKLFSGLKYVNCDSEYVAEIDLGDEDYEIWFQILRTLESLGIVVGFVLVARKLIHGGD